MTLTDPALEELRVRAAALGIDGIDTMDAEALGSAITAAERDAKPGRPELLERARELEISGRSSMNLEQLTTAIAKAERDSARTVGEDGGAALVEVAQERYNRLMARVRAHNTHEPAATPEEA